MTQTEATQRVAEACLAENRPLTDALTAWAPAAAATAASGDLKRTLKKLGYDDRLAALGAVRSASLRPARKLLADVPAKAELRLPLLQTCVWFAFLALIQLAVVAVLSTKVFPVLAKILDDHRLPPPVFADAVVEGGLVKVAAVVLAAIAAFGWVGPAWLPGWGRTLRKAREAAIGAALAESGPPAEVWADWIRGSPVLQRMGAATAADLRVLSNEWSRRAEAQLARFVAAYRFFGFALFTLIALALAAHVYGVCARLVQVQ